jgi:hypothetical protein
LNDVIQSAIKIRFIMFSEYLENESAEWTLSLYNDQLVDQLRSATTHGDPHVRSMHTTSSRDVYYTFSEENAEMSAFLVGSDGLMEKFTKENSPKEFGLVKSLDIFNAFLENAWAKVSDLSDGLHKLYVMQRLDGGMPPKAEQVCKTTTTTYCISGNNNKVCAEIKQEKCKPAK